MSKAIFDRGTLTIHIPMKLERKGGRKLIIAPAGLESWSPPPPKPDNALIKALGRAHGWRRMLETGTYRTVAELAREEKVTESYVSRLLRLTSLAPDIIEAILDGRQPKGMKLADLMQDIPLGWGEQREKLGFAQFHTESSIWGALPSTTGFRIGVESRWANPLKSRQ